MKNEEMKKEEVLRVKEFNNPASDTERDVNKFLAEIGSKCVSVTPLYNTVVGGIDYVVVYHTIMKP